MHDIGRCTLVGNAVRLLAAVLCVACAHAHAALCHVTPTGHLAGFDWAHSASLQSALANAACSEIWVRQGVYFPTQTTDTSISFSVRPDVAVYGGFAGSESLRSQRDPVTNVTILSGDIDHNDANAATTGIDVDAENIAGSNSNHVVVMDGTTAAGNITATTVLDGFTITGGDSDSYGGGLLCSGSDGHVCSPALENLVFSGNRADGGGGFAALAEVGASSPSFERVTFVGNSAFAGGAVYDNAPEGTFSPTFRDVSFVENRAVYYGGALYIMCGGSGSSSLAMVNAIISGNSSGQVGGAIANVVDDFSSCTIDTSLNGVTISGNSADGVGGAIVNGFRGNGPQAVVSSTLQNVIVWANSSPQIVGFAPEWATLSSTVDHSVLQEGCPDYATCANLRTADPMLGPLQDNGGATLTMRPGAAGSAIDAGDDMTCSDVDQRGVARPRGAHCDIGAVELKTCHVDANAAGGGDGLSWDTAYAGLQEALANSACEGVLVARGVYKPAAAGNATASFVVKPGVGVAGGFAASGDPRLRDPSAYPTVLSGDIDGNDANAGGTDVDVTTADIAGTNSRSVVVIDGTTGAGNVDADTMLDGLTITGGDATVDGGGVRCIGSNDHRCNPTLSNLLFSGNRAAAAGGALHADGASGTSSPAILATTFRGNSAASGGAIYARGVGGTSSPTLTNVTLSGNGAVKGGAIYLDGSASGASSPTLTNVTFVGNVASSGGNAMYDDGGNSGLSLTVPSLRNVILWDATPEITDVNASPFIDASIVKGGCPDASSTCTNVSASDPLLGALAAYGGATPTYLPPLGSPAIDAGKDATCPARDQRGATRPQGAHCDIGATESDRLFADNFGPGS